MARGINIATPSRRAHNRASLQGQRFGRLLVIERQGSDKHQKSIWLCQCDCGAETRVGTTALRQGKSRSCGCYSADLLRARNRSHGQAGTRTYRIWQAMLNRCRNEKTIQYANYGGRGIEVCSRWHSYESFLRDMGECPPGDHSIDRIDNDGNYELSNCRWATRKQQNRNKSSNRVITFNGVSKLLCEWASDLGIDQASLRERLVKWSLEGALTRSKRIQDV